MRGSLFLRCIPESDFQHYFWDRQGDAVLGAYSNGKAAECRDISSSTRPACVRIAWPAVWSAYDREREMVRESWHGSLLESKRDPTGLQHRRNRFYDPSAGRFTQEDPIGLAGGINLYGFAQGDPVNYADPFGLWPCGPFNALCARAVVFLLGRLLPAATIIGTEASTGLSARSAAGGRLTGAALRQAGVGGERAVEAQLLQQGTTILGRQVSAQTSAGRRVIDFLVQKPDGSMAAIEAKSGNAVRSGTQLLKDLLMQTEGATLVGKNAPSELRGVTVTIPTEVMRP